MKVLVTKATASGNLADETFQHGLLEYRNTPRSNGRSPAQTVFGHPLRSPVPAHRSAFAPEWQAASLLCDQRAAADADKQRTKYDETAKQLSPLAMGTRVRVQDHATKQWDRVGIIVSIGRHRDYRVKFPSGNVLVAKPAVPLSRSV